LGVLLDEATHPRTTLPAALSPRDRRILARAFRKLGDSRDFGQALHALREATCELIPAGRIYLLGERDGSPVVGSIVSGGASSNARAAS
jgi:hypothetical protein